MNVWKDILASFFYADNGSSRFLLKTLAYTKLHGVAFQKAAVFIYKYTALRT
jgi:hypothetical protein